MRCPLLLVASGTLEIAAQGARETRAHAMIASTKPPSQPNGQHNGQDNQSHESDQERRGTNVEISRHANKRLVEKDEGAPDQERRFPRLVRSAVGGLESIALEEIAVEGYFHFRFL